MERFIIGFIAIMFGITFILAGILKWKRVLYFNPLAEVWIQYIGLTLYRLLHVIIGVTWIIWIVSSFFCN